MPRRPLMRRPLMRQLARWHIWLGWAVGVPLLLWTASGLFMAARPMDEVRGTTLRIAHDPQPVRVMLDGADVDGTGGETLIREGRLINQRGRSILLATFPDGSVARIDMEGGAARRLAPVDEAEARRAVAYAITGGRAVVSVRAFDAAHAPQDLRKPIATWQVALADGTHVYVGRDSGEIEAVRTRWWRAYDFMWGLHIMDLQTREDTSHGFLWVFGGLAFLACLMGTTLMFRRRSAR